MVNKTLKYTLGMLFFVTISCSIGIGIEETVYPKAETDIYLGSTESLFDKMGDGYFPVSFSIIELEKIQNATTQLLHIKVEYGGGEGGCPTHQFFLQWDGTFDVNKSGSKQANVGLADFINMETNCEALVQEVLKYDLTEIFGGELASIHSIAIRNLFKNTSDTLTIGD